jgi:hypothetical protein
MIKNKSSSVKLDLGGAENEEEEEFEEEEEEGEIPEMDRELEDMDDEVLDMDDVGEPQVNEKEEENNIIEEYPTEEQNSAKYAEGVNSGDDNQIRKVETQKSNLNSKNQKDITIKQDQGEKTVFTRLSEELYKKFLKRDQSYKKTSAYDFFVNDKFLNKVVEKNDPSAAVKFGNFINRNKEYVDRKVARLNERIQNMTNEINSNCTGMPNGKIPLKEELRDPNEFLKDQLKYYETIGHQIESMRKDILTTTNSKMRDAPEISKKSKVLAEKKINEEIGTVVYDRLYKEKLNKEKKHIINDENVDRKEKQEKKKKTINEIKEFVEKLHNDAQERKMKKTQVLEDDKKLKEIYNIYNSGDELSTFNTKVLILEKFVQSFERSVHNLFNTRESVEINFDEYGKLMKSLGFILHDHLEKNETENSGVNTLESNLNPLSEELNNVIIESDESPKNKDNNFISNKTSAKNDKSNKQKEFTLLKDSWKILSNGDGSKINSNQLLVFCASVLGIYKGESESTAETGSESKPALDSNTNDVNTGNKTKTPTHKSGSIFQKNPKLNTAKNKTNKKIKIPNRFSTFKELTDYNTTYGSTAVGKTKNKSLNTSDKQSEKNPLKTVLPELDTSKYFYLNSTVKLIKELFIIMYLNRADFVAKEKKKSKESKFEQQHQNNHETLTINSSEKSRRSAENFKRRLYEEYETFKNNNSQSPNQSLSNNNTHSKKKKIKMEDIYRILKIKKEK